MHRFIMQNRKGAQNFCGRCANSIALIQNNFVVGKRYIFLLWDCLLGGSRIKHIHLAKEHSDVKRSSS